MGGNGLRGRYRRAARTPVVPRSGRLAALRACMGSPPDLALRDRGITGCYAAAAVHDRLPGALPSTTAHEGGFEVPPSDILVNDALQLARLWRRIAELSSWRPAA
jgi:hypothetical protein